MNTWFLHSKFKITVAAFLTALGLLLANRIDAAQWVSFTTWLRTDLSKPASSSGVDRIWPGHFAPVLIRGATTDDRKRFASIVSAASCTMRP